MATGKTIALTRRTFVVKVMSLLFNMLSWLVIWAYQVAQRLKHLPGMQESRVRSLGREDPLEKKMATTPVFLPGEVHGQRSLVSYSP